MDTYTFTINLAKEAGKLLREKKQQSFSIGFKHDNPRDIVTALDVEIGEFITKEIKSAFPEHSIHNEEAEDISGNEYKWAIDPIDGTSSFARGIPQYSISIGLLKDGVPELGAVLDPVANELFSFKRGEGVWLNGEPIRVSKHTELKSCYVLLAAGRKSEQHEWAGESLKKLLANVNKVKNFGSSAIWLCYIAAGRVDAVVAGTFSSMDIAAAVGILHESGGVITNPLGGSLEMSEASLRVYAANNETICSNLRKLLEPA